MSRIAKGLHRFRFHIAGGTLLAVLGLPALWIALAYGGLPRAWSHHEHKKGEGWSDVTSYTTQDIPGDPINLEFHGSGDAIEAAMRRAGWTRADPVTFATGLKIGASVVLFRPYPNAPVSPLFVHDRQQDFAYERDEGHSADKRHHVRFWQVAPGVWKGSATFDRGVGLSLFTLQITHHIGPDVDAERGAVAGVLAGGKPYALTPSGAGGRERRNGGGDKYVTDGRIAVISG